MPRFSCVNRNALGFGVPVDDVVNASSDEFSQHPRVTSSQASWQSSLLSNAEW
jgi:hypothetical protein